MQEIVRKEVRLSKGPFYEATMALSSPEGCRPCEFLSWHEVLAAVLLRLAKLRQYSFLSSHWQFRCCFGILDYSSCWKGSGIMEKTIGFIGCGKMAQAMIAGMINDGIAAPDQITASSRTQERLSDVQGKLGIRTSVDNLDVARTADYLFLAVPPIDYGLVINEIKHEVKESAIFITVAAGVTLEDVESSFGRRVKVVRSMPNTPSLIGAGMSALCANEQVTETELEEVLQLFRSFGEAAVIAESQMDAIPAVSGSSPAYVYMMIEALADGGVKQGLGREQAYRLAAQAVAGAARMVLETGKHPGELKDQVCSPGGATIAAVAELEQRQFRGAVLSAMDACTKRVRELGGE